MKFIFILLIIFAVHFVKAYAEQAGTAFYDKRKGTTTCPEKRSGSNQK